MSWFDYLNDGYEFATGLVKDVAPVLTAGAGLYSAYQGIQSARQASDYYDKMAGSAKLQDKIATEALNRNRPVADAQALASLNDLHRYLYEPFSEQRYRIDDASLQNTLIQNQLANTGLRYAQSAAPAIGASMEQRAMTQLQGDRLDAELMNQAHGYIPILSQRAYQTQGVIADENLLNAQTLMPLQRAVDTGNLVNAQNQTGLTGTLLNIAGQRLPGITDQQYGLQSSALESAAANLADYDATRGLQRKFYEQSERGVNPAGAMGRASAGIEHAMAGASGEMTRDAARRGIGMSSGQAQNMQHQNLIAKALGKSAARTKAWNDAEATNYARLGNAVNVRSGVAPATTGPALPNIGGVSGGFQVPSAITGGFSTGGLSLPGGGSAAMSAPNVPTAASYNGGANTWNNLASAAAGASGSNMEAAGYMLGSVLGKK